MITPVCSEERGGDQEKVFSRTVMGSQTTTTLSGLLPYTSYSCNITAHTSVGGGPAATTSVTTEQDGESAYNCFSYLSVTPSVPSGPPQDFTISVTSRSTHFLLVSSSLLTTEWSYHWL